ncbi:MAG: sugar phosphate isomerase/epimerase [Treponema sp.]|jgi:sugar phosphate isomerase/epimerase|nr:sugar phosphate isomerase/epimerase [Treponema sp.]
MSNFIKRSVTIYSFKDMVSEGRLTWEECISKIVNLGITGVELLGQLYFRECPEVNQEDLAAWQKMMWRYGTKTVAHDFFVDKFMYLGRTLTLREGSRIIENHVKFAAAIDCPIIRIGGTFDPELFRLAKPVCEDYGVKLGVEIHNGSSSWILPEIKETINIIRQMNSPYLGIIPDMSMFQQTIGDNSMPVFGAKQSGLDVQTIKDLQKAYESESNEEFRKRCDRMIEKIPEHEKGKRMGIFHLRRCENHDPKELIEHLPYVIHVHGKFWEMTEDNEEPSINYKEVLPVLAQGGYDGYISAEFEGMLPPGADAFEPQVRFQKLLDKYLGASYPSFPDPVVRPPQEDVACLSSKGYKNRKNKQGEITGVELYARSSYYRGIPLCLVENVDIKIDGVSYGTDKISFEIDGEVFTFAQMATVTAFYWNYGHLATIIVDLPGGLDEGKKHEVFFKYALRTYYLPFYMGGEATLSLDAI